MISPLAQAIVAERDDKELPEQGARQARSVY